MARINAELIEAGVADGAGEARLVLVHLVARDLEDPGVGVEEATFATSGVDAVHHLKRDLLYVTKKQFYNNLKIFTTYSYKIQNN